MSWIEELAGSLGIDRLTDTETDTLLDAARDVAHRVERKVTPLSTYLMGVAVGRGASLDAVTSTVRGLLPEGE